VKTVKELVDAATAEIETLSVGAARSAVEDGEALFVDIRDIRELNREGRIAGAVHVPRGMLEFWIDPTSPYHKPELATDKKLIFFCAAGWRSALATKTAQDMGFDHVAHMEGGFGAWRDAEGEVVAPKG
jgi:rhodanese-related sulfurtransferase